MRRTAAVERGFARGRIGVLLAAAAAVWLVGCAGGETPYRPAQRGEGYSEQQVGPGRYRVMFVGNTVTDQQTVEAYALYRAAEVTLKAGRDRFTVLEKDVERITSEHVIFDGPAGRSASDGDRVLDGGSFHGYARPVHRFRAVAVIEVAGRDGAAPDGERLFDAREVISRFGGKVGKPDAS